MLLLTFSNSISAANQFKPEIIDTVQVQGFPVFGKWMITPDFQPAHWLGEIYRNQKLREPINVIIVDYGAKNTAEAKARLLKAATDAGFPLRAGHSSGYWAWIEDTLYPQTPDTPSHAFSDEPFEFNNNHGRIFGPFTDSKKNRFIFVGAFSRERVAPLSNPKHQYVSFNQARDKFAQSMDQKTTFKKKDFLSLKNTFVGNKDFSTGDHDGMAVLLLWSDEQKTQP